MVLQLKGMHAFALALSMFVRLCVLRRSIIGRNREEFKMYLLRYVYAMPLVCVIVMYLSVCHLWIMVVVCRYHCVIIY
jgi:hypothetical protein